MFVGVAMLLIDRAGRRILILVGICGMTVSTLALASVFQIKEQSGTLDSSLAWLALVSLFCFMGFYEISLGCVGWTTGWHDAR
jgi:MFS family permease